MLLLLTACLYDRAQFLELSDHFNDHDGDGYSIVFGDCDDTTVDINPEIEEVCDGVDNGIHSPDSILPLAGLTRKNGQHPFRCPPHATNLHP